MTVPVDNSAGAPEAVTSTAVAVAGGGATGSVGERADADQQRDAAVRVRARTSRAQRGDPEQRRVAGHAGAGSHPYQMSVGFSAALSLLSPGDTIVSDGNPNDLTVNLPAGVVVNPNATPVKCTEAQLESDGQAGGGCPDASQVGVVRIGAVALGTPGLEDSNLYNMVPPPGVPAEFGFDALGVGVYEHLIGSVRTGGDYGLTATANPLIEKVPINSGTVTLWGSPSDPSHNAERGRCGSIAGSCPVAASTTPLLTMPSACSGPLQTSASMDSWQNPGTFASASSQTTDQNGNPVGVSGCDQLDFSPSISVVPTSSVADSPTGLNVDLSVPQPENLNGLAEANLKQAVVSLPAGMSVSPSAADGLQA